MKPSPLLSLLLAGLATANSLLPKGITAHDEGGLLIIPGSPDGIYTVTFDADGKIFNQTYKPMTELIQKRALHARDFPVNHFECGQGEMNPNDWNSAWGAFTSYCDRGGGANGHTGSAIVAGNAFAWICNKQDAFNPCFRSEYDNFVNFISNQCGGLRPGFADLDMWGKSYGRNIVGQGWCS